MTMTAIDNSRIIAAAAEMYRRLRAKGQTGPLARMSVEARYSGLTSAQRKELRQIIDDQATSQG